MSVRTSAILVMCQYLELFIVHMCLSDCVCAELHMHANLYLLTLKNVFRTAEKTWARLRLSLDQKYQGFTQKHEKYLNHDQTAFMEKQILLQKLLINMAIMLSLAKL